MHLAQQIKTVMLFTIVFDALIVHRNDRNCSLLYAADKWHLCVHRFSYWLFLYRNICLGLHTLICVCMSKTHNQYGLCFLNIIPMFALGARRERQNKLLNMLPIFPGKIDRRCWIRENWLSWGSLSQFQRTKKKVAVEAVLLLKILLHIIWMWCSLPCIVCQLCSLMLLKPLLTPCAGLSSTTDF